jgi:hypothetical protein
MTSFPAIIGRSEQLNFVDLEAQVPAKIDTGAYRSAIHCTKALEIKRKGQKILQVELLGHPCSPKVYPLEVTDYELVTVRNSFGHRAIRYKIKLRVKLGSKVFWSSFTLADRTNNIMPVLLGRELLKHRFLVDVAKTSVDRKELRQVYQANTATEKESEA